MQEFLILSWSLVALTIVITLFFFIPILIEIKRITTSVRKATEQIEKITTLSWISQTIKKICCRQKEKQQ